MTDHETSALRLYVSRRAAGTPAPEWGHWTSVVAPTGSAPGLAGLFGASTEHEAREKGDWERIRAEGRPWCRWLGHRTGITDDLFLQAFFTSVGDDECAWKRMSINARRRPTRCLAEWRAAGHRLIAAAHAAIEGKTAPGPLNGWPTSRGTGPRSLLRAR